MERGNTLSVFSYTPFLSKPCLSAKYRFPSQKGQSPYPVSSREKYFHLLAGSLLCPYQKPLKNQRTKHIFWFDLFLAFSRLFRVTWAVLTCRGLDNGPAKRFAGPGASSPRALGTASLPLTREELQAMREARKAEETAEAQAEREEDEDVMVYF